MPAALLKRVKEREDCGFKASNEYTVKMAIQRIFDARRSIQILMDIFINHTPLQKYFGQFHLHRKLKFFYDATKDQQKYYNDNFAAIK